jgi:hypothetical protein
VGGLGADPLALSSGSGPVAGRRRAWALVVALGAGCQLPGSLVVEVTLAPGQTQPTALLATMYDGHGVLATRRPLKANVPLPATLLYRAVPAAGQLRVVVSGGGLLGGAPALPQDGRQVRVTVVLSSGTPDRDGDGVPDELDNCPDVPNPGQENAVGVGPGDACRAGDGGVVVGCPSPGALLCDDFEAPLDPRIWSFGPTHGAITIDTARAHRGRSSVHLHTDAVGANVVATAELTAERVLPVHVFYLRAYFYVPANNPDLILTMLQQNTGPWEGLFVQGLLMTGSTFQVFDNRGGHAPGQLPTDQWFCFEWLVSNADASGSASTTSTVWMGDPQQSIISGTFTMPSAPIVRNLIFGQFVQDPGGYPASDYWLDDLIVDTKPIGCAR